MFLKPVFDTFPKVAKNSIYPCGLWHSLGIPCSNFPDDYISQNNPHESDSIFLHKSIRLNASGNIGNLDITKTSMIMEFGED